MRIVSGQDPGRLGDVVQVMDNPGGQELTERDGTEGGMPTAEIQVDLREVQSPQSLDVSRAEPRKFDEKFGERPAAAFLELGEAIEGLERLFFAGPENQLRPGHPVLPLSMDQMADDIRGIGFKTADELAGKLGIDRSSPYRARAAVGFY